MSIYYTDGSCLNNGAKVNIGGFGIVELDDNGCFINAYSKRNENTTNNREELRAILRVFLTAGSPSPDGFTQPPIVYSDSAYCVNTFNDWLFRWKANNWIKSDGKQPENLDLIKIYYDYYIKGYRIDLRKVKGHSNNQWNNLADELATGKITSQEARKRYANDTMYEV